MTDKEKIRAEIERRINAIDLDSIEDWRYRLQREHDIELMKDILSFIDSMQEEPASEDLEEAAQNYTKEEYCVNWKEFEHTRDSGFTAMYHFKSGANWQKQQMMKEAIEADVFEVSDNDCSIYGYSHLELSVDEEHLYDRNLKDGDKVKIIIVKEE